MKTIYLIRHAESAPNPNIPEPDWPLSSLGVEQAQTLAKRLEDLSIDYLASSPYPRAIKTVQPYAKKWEIMIETHPDLRERKLSEEMIDNWKEELQNTWKDFDYKLPNGESSRECQDRVFRAIATIALSREEKVLGISSHGNAIALFLNKLDPSFDFDSWDKMGNPDIYKVIYDGANFLYAGH